ncbi:hypothetical protein F2P81_006302 [Scophthalmus maximus]|uniref:Uncharacterized protein n=1 Tax=Scophthalmus maximus TaxID=52904 RepID=A0A6A4TB78_SCOMX|nr:hypothetical protein F2P81_006302 [Scophthalmus maximus]
MKITSRPRSVWMNVTLDLGINPLFALLKQRYSTEASLQHSNLRDSSPGRLPQQVGRNGQQQLRPHQRWRQGLRQAEEKRPDCPSFANFKRRNFTNSSRRLCRQRKYLSGKVEKGSE